MYRILLWWPTKVAGHGRILADNFFMRRFWDLSFLFSERAHYKVSKKIIQSSNRTNGFEVTAPNRAHIHFSMIFRLCNLDFNKTLISVRNFLSIFLCAFPTQKWVKSDQNRVKFKNSKNWEKLHFFDILTTFIAPELEMSA